MRKLLWLLVVPALLSSGAAAQPRNFSEGRGLGIGLQAPCAISIRYWMSDERGLEGNFLLLTDNVCLAGKALFRLGDTSNFDLYALAGAWYLSLYDESRLQVFALAGMELSISRNLAINLEFGESLGFDQRYEFLISTGIHFYFQR
ncbi:MAG: hypothetical protein NUW06_01780 [Candidatus Acetothermia bacterium]|jgi:hypothetical protein|nr:hypothetical protein [Candidatus Acetothermia bacterium]MDH7504699.1 hypothetical protein [Candidatus Acetothermia bacterium]